MFIQRIESHSKWVKLLPIENITYKTHLSADAAINILTENIEPAKSRFFLLSKPAKTYEGNIEGNTFNFNRIIGYRNPFVPRIIGSVSSELDGTTIKVKMTLNPTVAILFTLIFGLFLLAGITAICISILTGDLKSSLVGILFALFPYGLAMLGFKFESIPTKKALRKLFQAKIISD